jgi:hypothetical protein
MEVSALIHKPAEAVVIHACRIRHFYLLCFVLMTFLSPYGNVLYMLIYGLAILALFYNKRYIYLNYVGEIQEHLKDDLINELNLHSYQCYQ